MPIVKEFVPQLTEEQIQQRREREARYHKVMMDSGAKFLPSKNINIYRMDGIN